MKKLMSFGLVAVSALTLSATAASAQPYGGRYDNDRGYDQRLSYGERWDGDRGWRDDRGGWMNINARQAQLDNRIDRGVRQGRLTRAEAQRLRAEFYQIARLENRYRAGGLSNWERADLDRRFDRLSAQIRYEGRDNDYGHGYGRDYRR
ncbi:MAG: hypothetical protein Q8M88_05575 [Phenylobacterium sp.]|uniref:hypothetical protein n=1 Tax=Phenylobacterium sp. TaxID=1871053 RepID=UPI0027360390|nr:hypothetical protein [Phenylobacterium sp.]MDP3173886.1 hypothetical protein [Phenylobacterium sp.]